MGTKIVIPNADFSANAIYQEVERQPVQTTLVNGYCSVLNPGKLEIDRNASSNAIRVRTGEIYGKWYVKTNEGYVIRAIAIYDTSVDLSTAGDKSTSGAVLAANVQGLSEYSFEVAGKYAIITFCKTHATQPISASEDIVDELYYI